MERAVVQRTFAERASIWLRGRTAAVIVIGFSVLLAVLIAVESGASQLANVVVTGGMWALLAAGLALVFGVMNIPHFAHGESFMVGAYVGYFVFTPISAYLKENPNGTLQLLAPLVGVLAAMVVGAVLGAFLERVKKNLGEYPGIYTRASFWNPNVASRSLWGKLRLWIALYNSNVAHPWEGLNKQYKPRDWDKPLIWQWSADGNGRGREFGAQSNSIDINRFMGTETEFEAYINRRQAQPDPQPDPEPPLQITHEMLVKMWNQIKI